MNENKQSFIEYFFSTFQYYDKGIKMPPLDDPYPSRVNEAHEWTPVLIQGDYLDNRLWVIAGAKRSKYER